MNESINQLLPSHCILKRKIAYFWPYLFEHLLHRAVMLEITFYLHDLISPKRKCQLVQLMFPNHYIVITTCPLACPLVQNTLVSFRGKYILVHIKKQKACPCFTKTQRDFWVKKAVAHELQSLFPKTEVEIAQTKHMWGFCVVWGWVVGKD